MKTFFTTILSATLCLFLGFIAQLFQTEALLEWYPHLIKSTLTPPGIIFPIVWTIIYALMGISVGLLWNRHIPQRKGLLYLFIVQFTLNFLWSIMFFYFQNPLLGLFNIFKSYCCITIIISFKTFIKEYRRIIFKANKIAFRNCFIYKLIIYKIYIVCYIFICI